MYSILMKHMNNHFIKLFLDLVFVCLLGLYTNMSVGDFVGQKGVGSPGVGVMDHCDHFYVIAGH